MPSASTGTGTASIPGAGAPARVPVSEYPGSSKATRVTPGRGGKRTSATAGPDPGRSRRRPPDDPGGGRRRPADPTDIGRPGSSVAWPTRRDRRSRAPCSERPGRPHGPGPGPVGSGEAGQIGHAGPEVHDRPSFIHSGWRLVAGSPRWHRRPPGWPNRPDWSGSPGPGAVRSTPAPDRGRRRGGEAASAREDGRRSPSGRVPVRIASRRPCSSWVRSGGSASPSPGEAIVRATNRPTDGMKLDLSNDPVVRLT